MKTEAAAITKLCAHVTGIGDIIKKHFNKNKEQWYFCASNQEKSPKSITIMKLFILFLLMLPFAVFAQDESRATQKDSVLTLTPVVIKGYESGRSLLETPVAIGLVTS